MIDDLSKYQTAMGALLKVAGALEEALVEAGEPVPRGVLFAPLQAQGFGLKEYEMIEHALIATGRVRRRPGQLLEAIDGRSWTKFAGVREDPGDHDDDHPWLDCFGDVHDGG